MVQCFNDAVLSGLSFIFIKKQNVHLISQTYSKNYPRSEIFKFIGPFYRVPMFCSGGLIIASNHLAKTHIFWYSEYRIHQYTYFRKVLLYFQMSECLIFIQNRKSVAIFYFNLTHINVFSNLYRSIAANFIMEISDRNLFIHAACIFQVSKIDVIFIFYLLKCKF